MHRIMRKLAQAAKSIGLENQVFPDVETVDQNFTESREEIRRLRNEEADLLEEGGDKAAAFTGEEFRQELRKGLKEYEEQVKSLPWAAGSGFVGEQAGFLFCARIGEEMFLRFVPEEHQEEVVTDTLTCLRMAQCSPDTERRLSQEMKEQVYDAWKRARKTIHSHWQFQTDPRNIEPEIRPLFRRVAEHIRKYPPPDMQQQMLEEIYESVEAPWGRRYERELREVFKPEVDSTKKSVMLIEKIRELGLQPFEAPKPLPPIEEEDIKLVCWLAISED